MKKKIIVGIIILVAIAVVLKLTVLRGDKSSEVTYKIEAITKGSIQALVDTTGTLNPVTIVDVGSQVSGKILEIFVDFNSEVKAGQIIAKIDQELFLTKVNQNQANYKSSLASMEKSQVTLDSAKRKLDRALNLFEKELISFEEKETAETTFYGAKSDLQSAAARLEQAQSQLNTSKVDLAYTVIKSPIDGVVINRNINMGQTVAASFQAPVLFQIANDLSKMQVECSVDEADIGKVKEEQQVKFTVDAFPNDNFRGVVKQVRYSPEVVSNVVTYTTIVEVENPELKLRPGMTATVSIVIGEARDKLLVPNGALRFNPSLSQEEMQAMFVEMRGGGERGNSNRAASPDGSSQARQPRQKPEGSHPSMGTMGGGQRMRDRGRVWVQDETGKLKMVFIRTGVTDNVHTEIVSGDLEEGQEIITGQTGGEDSRSNNAMRMMRFMR